MDALLEKADQNKKIDVPNQFTANKSVTAYMPDDFDTINKLPKLKREFGGLKGLVKHIADDFDEPLDDFKDYM